MHPHDGQSSIGIAQQDDAVRSEKRPVVPSVLLHRLLTELGVQCAEGDIEAACSKAEASLSSVQPVDQAHYILTQAQVKGVQPLQIPWRRFDVRRLPALVWFEGDWFLAWRVDTDTILLVDASGREQKMPEVELQDALVMWLRTAAQRTPGSSVLKGSAAAGLVWREMFRESGWVTKVVVATVIINLLAISTSLYAMQVYDRVVPTMAYTTMTTMVVGMVLIIVMDWILKTLRARILDSVAIAVDKRVSQQVFDHLLHLRLDVQPKSLGTLAAQVGGLDSVRQFFSSTVVFGLIDLPFALLFIGFIAIIGGKVGWVYAGLLPVALMLGLVSQIRLRDLMRKQLMRHNERQGLLVDAIRGAESIRAGNATWRFSEEWQAITASIDRYNILQKAINNFSSVTASSLSTLAYVAAVVVGVWQIEAGLLTMGGLIACSILGGRVISPIAQGVQYLAQWQGVRQSLSMVDQVLKLDTERRADQDLMLPEQLPEAIGVEQIRFTYPESPVQQIRIDNLTIRAGERVLLLGPVGCGKSTLLKIMAGLYRPNEGRVRLGDADLWEIDPQVVASHIGYLPQAVHLFKGTLRSNLALSGRAGDSRLLKIARDLGVEEIATSSPLGMNLVISEGGEGLSGGQRQLVALARVLIDQPRVWLLDEPTASLDADSEARVWTVLEQIVGQDDILVIATHKPMQAMKLATRVVVMQQGEVVKDGKPEIVLPQLMARAPASHVANIPRGGAGGALDVV